MTPDNPPTPPFGLDRQAILAAASRLHQRTGTHDAISMRTRRMTLRQWRAGDQSDLAALDSDARVIRHLIDLHVTSQREALAFMAIANALMARNEGLGLWRAGACDDDRFLGYFVLAPGPEGHIEVGARLASTAWGRGYALEGSHLLCAYGIETLHLPAIWGFCHPENRAVPVLLRRLHFTPLGATTHLGHDALAFRLDAKAWRRNPFPARPRDVIGRTARHDGDTARPWGQP